MDKYVIHCETQKEFDRMVELFNVPKSERKYLNWDFYGADTVFFPKEKQYGVINGVCKDENYLIRKSNEF